MPPLGDDGGSCLDLELADDLVRGRFAAGGVGGHQDVAARPRDRAVGRGQLGDAVAREDAQAPRRFGFIDLGREGGDQTGTGAPGDVEAGHGVCRPGRRVPAALGPAHDGEERHPALTQPRALLAVREVEVRPGPSRGPLVLCPVESGGGEPVLLGELRGVSDAHAALLGRVDEEQAAERPPCLSAEIDAGLLVDDRDRPPGAQNLARGHEPCQPPSHDENIGAVGCGHVHSFVGASGSTGRVGRDPAVGPMPAGSNVFTMAYAARCR